eukprot:13429283-Alexandrium_andersonii.AAC.1
MAHRCSATACGGPQPPSRIHATDPATWATTTGSLGEPRTAHITPRPVTVHGGPTPGSSRPP